MSTSGGSSNLHEDPDLPGFYRDPVTNKYFRIVPGHCDHNALTQPEVEAKRIKLDDEKKVEKLQNHNFLDLIRQRSLGYNHGLAFQHNSVTNMMKTMQVTKPVFREVFKADNIVRMLLNQTRSDVFAYSRVSASYNDPRFVGDFHHSMELLHPVTRKNPDEEEFRSNQHVIFPGEVEAYDIIKRPDTGASCLITSERTESTGNRYLQLYMFPEVQQRYRLTLSMGLRSVKTISCCQQDIRPLRIVFSQRKSMVVCLDLDEVHVEDRQRGQYEINFSETITASHYPHVNLIAIGSARGNVKLKDLREDKMCKAVTFTGERGCISKVEVLRNNDNLVVSEFMGYRHKICLHDSRNTRKPVLEYINHRSISLLNSTPFYIDSNEGFLLADAQIERNHGCDHMIRVYDVRRGHEVAAYPDFDQLFYEESWPMFQHQAGFLGIRTADKPSIHWLPLSRAFRL